MITQGGTTRIGTAAHAAAPTDGVTTPDLTLSPRTPWGAWTSGFLWAIHTPTAPVGIAAAAAAGGYTVTIWVRNPVTYRWAQFTSLTDVDARELNVTYDCGPAELYFQIGNVSTAGSLDLEVLEQ